MRASYAVEARCCLPVVAAVAVTVAVSSARASGGKPTRTCRAARSEDRKRAAELCMASVSRVSADYSIRLLGVKARLDRSDFCVT